MSSASPRVRPKIEASPVSGERLSLDRVYTEHADRVRRLVARSNVAERDRDDMVQTIWLSIANTLQNYDPAEGSLTAWIHTVSTRAIRDHLMLGRTRNEIPVGDPFPAPVVASTDAHLTVLDLFASLLSVLDAQERHMVQRHWIEGVDRPTVNRELNLTAGEGQALLRRAQAKLVAAAKRHSAEERRVLGRLRMLLLPWPDGTWVRFERVRSVALRCMKGLAVIVASGAVVAPVYTGGPAAHMATAPAADIAPAPVLAAAMATAPTSAEAKAPELARANAPKRSVSAPRVDPVSERLSLESIQRLMATDPSAALTALAKHRRTFPRETLHDERLLIEADARIRAGAKR